MSYKFRYSILLLLVVLGFIAVALTSYHLGVQAGAKNAAAIDFLDIPAVSLAELDSIAGKRSIFYQGSNTQFHYLRIEEVGYLRLRKSDSAIPMYGFDGDASRPVGMIWGALFIENGKLKSPNSPPNGKSGLF